MASVVSCGGEMRVAAETVTVEGVPSRPSASALATSFSGWLEREGILVFVLAASLVGALFALGRALTGDGWLALLAGRQIAQHGLPSHDSLTIWTAGERWVDQQWLGQLSLYGLARLGGIELAVLVNLALGVGSLAVAAFVARKGGASPRAVVWVLLLVLLPYALISWAMRPQSLAYPLFVALIWMLARESRSPSRRVYLALPLLVLWANLHGSAVLGAALVVLYGLLFIGGNIRKWPARAWLPRAALLTLAPIGCLFVSPYATGLPHYYKATLLNSRFSSSVEEWMPTTLSPVTLTHYVLGFGCLWTLGKAGSRYTAFEKCALVATFVLSLLAIRNLIWFDLAAVCFVPVGLEAVLSRRQATSIGRLNRLLGFAAIVIIAGAFLVVVTRPAAWFMRGYPSRGADTVASAAARSSSPVFADELYADWLMWQHPELEGHIAYDVRFELLNTRRLDQIVAFRHALGPDLRAAQGYRLLVLNSLVDKSSIALLEKQGAPVLFAGSDLVVLRRAAQPATS